MNYKFENIESEKRVELNERLWQRVEDKLDVNKYKSKSTKYQWLSAAAVLLILLSVAINSYPTSTQSKYRVTELTIDDLDSKPQINIEQQNYLKALYNNLVNCTLKKDKYAC